MEQPQRIQRKRTKGYKTPPNTVYVGRPGKWGNPYKISDAGNRCAAVQLFRELVNREVANPSLPYPSIAEIKKELAGKNLSCFCKLGEICHADILLKIANS